MPKVILNGEEGKEWKNKTAKAAYQFFCTLDHTCGTCLQYHHAISNSLWPIPLHRGCNCHQTAIAPGEVAEPWVDMRALLRDMTPANKRAAVGASNFKLLESGKAKWDDVVTGARVRTLREVVARNKLSVEEMKRVGIKEHIATQAYESVHTGAHAIQATHRKGAHIQSQEGRLE